MARTPPMYWSSWYSLTRGLSCSSAANQLSEMAVLGVADALVSTGLAAQGFRTMVLDDCWQNATRNASGFLHGDARTFPRGIGFLVRHLAKQGFALGLYTTPGDYTCMKRPASRGHEQQDVRLWIEEWGARYLKYCVCNTTHARREVAYDQMQRILGDTRLPVVYEIDPAVEFPMTRMDGIGHVVGAHDDVADSYPAWTQAILDLESWGVYRGNHTRPGHWPLIDVMQVGRGGQSFAEYRSQVSMYVMLCSPISLGIDLRNETWAAAALPHLLNAEVWDIHQDPLGKHASLIGGAAASQVWARPLEDGGFAVALWNTLGHAPVPISFKMIDVTGTLGRWQVRDVWSQSDVGIAEASWSVPAVPPHALTLLRLVPIPEVVFA